MAAHLNDAMEIDIRDAQSKLTIEEHIKLRRMTTGGHVLCSLVEMMLGLNLPDDAMEHPIVHRLQDCLIDIPGWANELHSLKDELSHGSVTNMVSIVMKELNLDLQSAVDYVGHRIKTRVDDYIATKATLPSWGPEVDKELGIYLTHCEYFVAGYLHLGLVSHRYLNGQMEEVGGAYWVTLSPETAAQLARL